ncbi:MAG: PQQ-binding-like beta-propeller repeat protein, partial [Hyphomicrobiales bacterium]
EQAPLPGERIAVSADVNVLEVQGGEVTIPAAINNSSWAQPGGTTNNAPGNLAAGSSLSRVWSASAGSGSSGDGKLTSPPIVVAGVIYVLDAEASVSAFSARNGKRIWRVNLTPDGENSEEGYGGGVAADFGRIVVATGFGEVFGLDPSNGGILWKRSLGLPIRSAPTAANGRVFVVTVNNEVHTLDIETGEVSWNFRRYSESAGVLANTSPAVEGKTVVVPYRSGELLAFDTETGKPIWGDALTRTGRLSSVGAINDIAGRPAISGGSVYAVSHSGRLAAIDLKSGRRLWAKNVASTQTPWVAGNTLFVVTTGAEIVALNTKDGNVVWVKKLPLWQDPENKKDRIVYSGPVLAGGRLLVTSSIGDLIALQPQTGVVATKSSAGDGFYIPPVIAGGGVYLLSDSAQLIAMR